MSEYKKIYLASPHMGGHERQYIEDAFRTNWIAPLGENVNRFEEEIAEYVGSKGAVAVSSGTAAIHLALVLLGIEPGDIVFCSTLTFVASANPILYQKATPVFIDSDPETWNMSPDALEKALKEYAAKGKLPKAVIVVNLYGQSADYDKIKTVCDFYEVPIVEDAAESLGATYNNVMSGTIGKFGVFSFNGNKIITTSGGGMLVSDDLEALSKARFFATQARDKAIHYQHSEIGYNYRMSNVLAGIGRGQLRVLGDRILKKREIYDLYKEHLSSYEGVRFMPEAEYGKATRWLTTMTVRPEVTSISHIIDSLNCYNIESRPVWKPLHLQPLFHEVDFFTADGTDVSGDLYKHGVCLPSDTNMSIDDQMFVIERIQSNFKHLDLHNN
ncbi:putative pyridoxal phosphate-dependent aminotransferase EpsN [compost metagenome]